MLLSLCAEPVLQLLQQATGKTTTHAAPPENEQSSVLHFHNVMSTLHKIDFIEATSPDGVRSCVLKEYNDQLIDVVTNTFSLSLQQATVPTCLKSSTIVPVPKRLAVKCWNDYCAVALTPIIMECIVRLIMAHIRTVIPLISTSTSLHTEQTDLSRMQFLLHFTQPSCAWDNKTHI